MELHMSLADIAEENRRLKEELEQLRKAHQAAVQSTEPLSLTRKFHEDECLKSDEFAASRSKAAKEALDDDVSHEFFSAHEKNTALNIQRDIRQSLKRSEERRRQLEDALNVLRQAHDHVDTSARTAEEKVNMSFKLFQEQLDGKEREFFRDLKNHQNGEVSRIQQEQRVVEQLLSTLRKLVEEAEEVMAGPKPSDSQLQSNDYKTLAEIKDEFSKLRQSLFPWDTSFLFDQIKAKASEQLIDIRTTAVHDIITGLVETLNAAMGKAEATLQNLGAFIDEVNKVVPETMQLIREEFQRFAKVGQEKRGLFLQKISEYRKNYSCRIETEVDLVNEQQSRLLKTTESAKQAVRSGNDYHLLNCLELLNKALVAVDGNTLTLGYDRIDFTPCASILTSQINQLGILHRHEIDCKPLVTNYFQYYQFLEHKEYIYGSSEVSDAQPDLSVNTEVSDRRREMFREAFKKIDVDGNGTLDAKELEGLWKEVFTSASPEVVSNISARVFADIDSDKTGIIAFDRFMNYLTKGIRTNLAAERELFYRRPTVFHRKPAQ